MSLLWLCTNTIRITNVASKLYSDSVVVVLLEEWLLPKPDICGSNPVIRKFYSLSTVLEKQAGDGPTQKTFCFH